MPLTLRHFRQPDNICTWTRLPKDWKKNVGHVTSQIRGFIETAYKLMPCQKNLRHVEDKLYMQITIHIVESANPQKREQILKK